MIFILTDCTSKTRQKYTVNIRYFRGFKTNCVEYYFFVMMLAN